MRVKPDRLSAFRGTKRYIDRQSVILAVLLIAGTWLVYFQVWRFGFMTIDDQLYVTANRHVEEGITLSGIVWSFTTTHDANWIPFTWLSLMVDTDIYGVRPGGYHITNVLFHTANTLLLFAALAAATGERARSAFVAGLFALHPLHVESVAWIAERKDVLSTFFGLASLLMYVRYALGNGRRNLAVCFVFMVASLLSKQTLVTLPFVFLLFDFWPLNRWAWAQRLWLPAEVLSQGREIAQPPGLKRNTKPAAVGPRGAIALVGEKIPFFLVSILFSVIASLAQSKGGALLTANTLPLYAREMNALFVYVAYLWKAVYPHDLAVYYPYAGPELTRTVVTLSALLLVAVSLLAALFVRRCPALLVGWCWYLGTLLPMIGLVQIGAQQMADRYTYFPLIGIFLAAGWLASELAPSGAWRACVLPATAIGLLVVLGAAAFHQTSLWADNVVLLRHSKNVTRDHSLAHEFLGSALLAKGDWAASLVELKVAVAMAPHSAMAHYRLGLALQESGRFDEALDQYRLALSIDDAFAPTHNNLGLLLLKRRLFEEARRHYVRAIELDPDLVDAHVNLAFLCLTLRDYPQAIAEARCALELNPKSPAACHVCIALALRGEGRLEEAIGELEAVLRSTPDDQVARQELARTLSIKRGR